MKPRIATLEMPPGKGFSNTENPLMLLLAECIIANALIEASW
jgi:hypothetical protein